MTDPLRPWADHQILSDMLAGWRQLYRGRGLFRLAAGSDFLRLHLEGESRPAIWLTWLPGASLIFASAGALAPVLSRALPTQRQHPLALLLNEATLTELGIFPQDRVAALEMLRPDGSKVYLMHQLFGSRGNTVLLDQASRLLWSRHRPPHNLLAAVPKPMVWSSGTPHGTGDTASRLAMGYLITRLTTQYLQRGETAVARSLRTARRLVDNLQRDFDRAEQGDHFRRQAEALAANLHLVKQGQQMLATPDLRDGKPLEIALDPALSPAANLNAWFRRARKAEKGRDIILNRLQEAMAYADHLALASSRLDDIAASNCEELDCLESVLDWQEAHATLLPTGGDNSTRSPAHGPEEPARPFRRYLVDEKYEVWVGRNNKENDILTHRASHSKDLWFHAQCVAGSHVILRTSGEPDAVPRGVIEKAAALAALNSKARHSSLVPVIFTERRFVRKPRKSPPGLASCLREKNIFVEPGIAPGVRPI